MQASSLTGIPDLIESRRRSRGSVVVVCMLLVALYLAPFLGHPQVLAIHNEMHTIKYDLILLLFLSLF
jgi:hypothetical protein